jgi:hypothetical protein
MKEKTLLVRKIPVQCACRTSDLLRNIPHGNCLLAAFPEQPACRVDNPKSQCLLAFWSSGARAPRSFRHYVVLIVHN